jgi:hypothetical protein
MKLISMTDFVFKVLFENYSVVKQSTYFIVVDSHNYFIDETN